MHCNPDTLATRVKLPIHLMASEANLVHGIDDGAGSRVFEATLQHCCLSCCGVVLSLGSLRCTNAVIGI